MEFNSGFKGLNCFVVILDKTGTYDCVGVISWTSDAQVALIAAIIRWLPTTMK